MPAHGLSPAGVVKGSCVITVWSHSIAPTLTKDNKGKVTCTRRRVRGTDKWGQALADATWTELASAGGSQS